MKKKIYVVWFPGQEQNAVFFDNWEATQARVSGVSGIRYRSFPDRKHAEEFLGIIPADHGVTETGGVGTGSLFSESARDTLVIYVDGSYKDGCEYAGWGWVALSYRVSDTDELAKAESKEIKVGEDSGLTSGPAQSRNIDGEIQAVIEALQWTERYLRSQNRDWKQSHVVILYDYEGIAAWALGKWKAKTPLTQNYQKHLYPYRNRLTFKKVTAHAGKKWNEYVDRLARKSIEKFR